MSETRIASFVVRFVQETTDQSEPDRAPAGRLSAGWRGVIRHVQSRQEARFTEMTEALAFMDRYVTLKEDSGAAPSSAALDGGAEEDVRDRA